MLPNPANWLLLPLCVLLMCDNAKLGLGLGLGSRLRARLGFGLGLVLGC